MSDEHLKCASPQPFAIRVFHGLLESMLGEVIRKSTKAVSDLSSH